MGRASVAVGGPPCDDVPGMLGVVFSLLAYAAFLGSMGYFAAFCAGWWVPKTVDSGAAADPAFAVLVNLGLLLLFGLQHSIMARAPFKSWLTRLMPQRLERSCYVLASAIALGLLMWQWRPLPAVLWHVDGGAGAAVLWSFNALGWLVAAVSTVLIDHFNLFGIKQALGKDRESGATAFVTPLFYRYVRHPLMTGILMGVWITPHMTQGHALLALGMTCYVLIGVHFEERALVRELGPAYVAYQASTNKLVPWRSRKTPPSG